MYRSKSVDVSQIKKNSNDFSFISTVFDLGVNQDYISQKLSVLNTDITNEYTNIWQTLSAIGQDVGDSFLTSILNFLDNIGNIDLCNIKALESMIEFFGIYYNVFASIQNFPLEIQNLIDILSIPREYFYNKRKLSKLLISAIYENCSCDMTFISNSISAADALTNTRLDLLSSDLTSISLSNYLNYKVSNLSNYWHNSTNSNGISIDNDVYVDDLKLDNFISSVYYDFLLNLLNATYNDADNTLIYSLLSANILSGYSFSIYSGNANAETLRLQYNISKSFKLDAATDAYLYGLSSSNDFSVHELDLIFTEISCRTKPFEKTPLDGTTRYKYYREVKFKLYYDFVENQNINYNLLFNNAILYGLDNSYFEISSNIDASKDYSKNRLLSVINDSTVTLNLHYVESVVATLVEITNAIREIRHQIKMQCQKNFMKGTYALLYYVINEYLRNNIVKTIIKLRNSKLSPSESKFSLEFDLTKNKNEILTYIDPINYFNISCDGDISVDVNPRYWLLTSNIKAIGALDSTNVFKTPDTVNYNNEAFTDTEINNFYYDILKNRFDSNTLNIPKLSNYADTLYDFLDSIFSIGADTTKMDEEGNIVTIDDIDDNLRNYKEKLFNYYTGISSGYAPYYYFTNEVHPSYQIHPYLSGFIENMTYTYPIKNLVTTAVEDIIADLKKRIHKYLDANGYLINEWRNPLATNSDYLTKYERSSHINDKNFIDPVVDYDGLFYPYAVIQCIDNLANVMVAIRNNTPYCENILPELSTNFYYGLQFNTLNKDKLLNQLTTFRLLISNESQLQTPHCLYRYASDVYGNAYILLKNCRSTDDEDKQLSSAGILWVRYHNNPIAFPAFVKTNTSINDNDLAQLKIDSNTTNNRILSAETINFDFSDTKYYGMYQTYNIQDFYMSDDKKHIIININQLHNGKYVVVPCIGIINKEYDIAKDYVQFSIASMKNKIGSVDTICNMPITSLKDYTYDKFFMRDTLIGVIYHKVVDNTIGCYIPYVDIAKLTISQDDISAVIPLLFSIKPETNIAVDTDQNNNINIAYITNSNSKNASINAMNFISNDIKYSEISDYIRYSFNDDMLVTLTAYYGNLNRAENVIVEKNDSHNKYAQFYNTYTDNGFFGLVSSDSIRKNVLSNSILTYDYYNLSTKSSELAERGILKFLLLANAKRNCMDFKFVLPVRMFEAFANNNAQHLDTSKSLASYFDLHFNADISEYADSISSETRITDPKIILALFADKIPTVHIQEQYFNYVDSRGVVRLYDNTATFPYLWYSSTSEIPDKYFNPGKNNGEIGDDDNVIILVYPETLPISVSWYKSEDRIQLDFNTTYYKSFLQNNYFNEKRIFLSLEQSGQAGYLVTYKNIDAMKSGSSVIPECDVVYYIKNISDEYPKFLLSAVSSIDTKFDYFYLTTHNGTYLVTDESTDETKYRIVI